MASEEVVLELVATKCLPVLLYGLEVCPLTNTDKKSIDFVTTRFLMKLFKTVDMNVIKDCQTFFKFKSHSDLLEVRIKKFMNKVLCSDNICLHYK